MLRLFGAPIGRLSKVPLSVLIVAGMYVSFVARGVLVEKIIRDGFNFSWTSALLETAVATLLSFLDVRLSIPGASAVIGTAFSDHPMDSLVIALCMTAGKGLTWIAFLHLSYPAVLMLKSCKLISVMIGSMFVLSKRYSGREVVAALLIVSGVFVFSNGPSAKATGGTQISALGVVAGVAALSADALAFSTQEKALKAHNLHISDMMFASSLLCSSFLMIIAMLLGELQDVAAFLVNKPAMLYELLFLSVAGFVGAMFRNCIIKIYSSVVASGTGLGRKIVSVVVSFLFFQRPIHSFHFLGLSLFIMGSILSFKFRLRLPWQRSEILPTTETAAGDTELVERVTKEHVAKPLSDEGAAECASDSLQMLHHRPV